jgi:MFS family permease
MIKKHFSRKNLAKFKVNSVVKAFILAEMFLWSGLNFVMLFFSVYVATLPGGSIQHAATATSMYFLSRVFFVLVSGRLLTGKSKEYRFAITLAGMTMLSLCYILICLTSFILHIYILFAVIGALIGIVTPAKNTLFSSHINKEKESLTWSVLDAGVFLCMAITTSLGVCNRSLSYLLARMETLRKN